MRTLKRTATAVPLLAALSLLPATASAGLVGLERVGPTSPGNGYPIWYQDTTGLTLDLCVPNSQELLEGWCLLLPADVPNSAIPEVFPSNWAEEHFYWAAEIAEDWGNNRVRLVLALEATFALEEVHPGDQVVFGRLRMRVDDAPATGLYKFYTPYGMFEIQGTAGERIFVTRDIGVACPQGDFSCALQSDIGPFLLPSNTPGGPELPPVSGPVPGKLYIASPNRVGPVTGSPYGTYQTSSGPRNANIFRIEAPDGTVFESFNFSLMGRIYDGILPGLVHVDRASYAASHDAQKVEAFVTAFPTVAGRLPAQPAAPRITPQLTFHTEPCGGDPEGQPQAPAGAGVPMVRNGSLYWAKTEPIGDLPTEVCVTHENPVNGVGAPVPPNYIRAPLGDQINITGAYFNPNESRLTVVARSMDEVSPPTLQVGPIGGDDGFPATIFGSNGVATINNIVAPPSKVRVLSSNGGSNEAQVTTSPPPATGVVITPSVPSPATTGTAVTFTAQGQGSFGYEYRFYFKEISGDYQMVQDYGVGNSWTMPASTSPGTYRVMVYVRTNSNSGMDAQNAINFTVSVPAVSAVSLASNVPSPADVGSDVTFTATATGGTGQYQYRFYFRPASSSTYTMVQDYSSNNTWSIPTDTPVGDYRVMVYARSVGSTANVEAQTGMNFSLRPAAATGVTVTANATSPAVIGSDVTFTATGAGGGGDYEYRFYFKLQSAPSYTMVQDYSSDNTWSIPTDTPPGDYRVLVYVRSAGSTANLEAQNGLNFSLRNPPATGLVVTASSTTATVGDTVTITADGQGSTGYQYRFYFKLLSDPSYTLVQDYSSDNTWQIPTTTPAGEYRVLVYVRTATSGAQDQQAGVNVTFTDPVASN